MDEPPLLPRKPEWMHDRAAPALAEEEEVVAGRHLRPDRPDLQFAAIGEADGLLLVSDQFHKSGKPVTEDGISCHKRRECESHAEERRE